VGVGILQLDAHCSGTKICGVEVQGQKREVRIAYAGTIPNPGTGGSVNIRREEGREAREVNRFNIIRLAEVIGDNNAC
jgi:hypothetical protein